MEARGGLPIVAVGKINVAFGESHAGKGVRIRQDERATPSIGASRPIVTIVVLEGENAYPLDVGQGDHFSCIVQLAVLPLTGYHDPRNVIWRGRIEISSIETS